MGASSEPLLCSKGERAARAARPAVVKPLRRRRWMAAAGVALSLSAVLLGIISSARTGYWGQGSTGGGHQDHGGFQDFTWNLADPVVQTKDGPVRGFVVNNTVQFLGIPYASPPVNNLRFASPIPANAWTETLNATEFSPGCPQKCELPDLMCPLKQSEDCLYLNVYAPGGTPPKEGWPVYVFIHGGGFVDGAGGCPAYNGRAFAAQGLVLVNLNYRLGALGWLSYGNEIKGNFGLEDQRLALQWTQANIGAFGGDKTRVTVGGESAGGISVITHLASQASTGLFHRAVIESGPLSIPFNEFGSDNRYYTRYVNDANCINAAHVAECLRSQSVETLLNVQVRSLLFPTSLLTCTPPHFFSQRRYESRENAVEATE